MGPQTNLLPVSACFPADLFFATIHAASRIELKQKFVLALHISELPKSMLLKAKDRQRQPFHHLLRKLSAWKNQPDHGKNGTMDASPSRGKPFAGQRFFCPNQSMQFPSNYAVVVSTRPVEPLFGNLRANATGVLDLSAEEFAVSCKKDLKKFIINYIYSDENVSRCWQDANYNDDELREKIGSKDKSFLYAQYVLQGVADGMYHFDLLDKELPAGLTAFYEQSFRYRFATEAEYNVVRPLLKLLLENDSVTIEDASACLQMPVGKLVKLLQGYCVFSDNTLTLSDASRGTHTIRSKN